MNTNILKTLVVICFAAGGMAPKICRADATPLNLYQLDGFVQYTGCESSGGETSCASPNAVWEKNLDNIVNEEDLALAIREYWDDGGLEYVCYKNRVGDTYSLERDPAECNMDCAVVPHSLCDPGAAECLQTRTPAECEDVDRDGIRKWQEDLVGSSDHIANASCNKAVSPESCGFTQVCTDNLTYVDPTSGAILPILSNIGDAICAPRSDCVEGQCTAFHLETASVNNNELIVYVVFDYAPVPPTIVDLYIDYDFNFLTLLDARALRVPCASDPASMCDFGKDLTVSHPAENRLRLTLLSPNSSETIPMGNPIIELVFDRIANGQTNVGFTTQDHLQVAALAPDQGSNENGNSIRNDLAKDALWGDKIQVPAVDPNGPRLLLYYSFDNQSNYLDYADVKDGVALCSLIGTCAVLDETDDYQREKKEIIQAKLNTLQKGQTRVSEQIENGVIGPAAYLDGRTDHLEMPITVNDPVRDSDGQYYFQKKDQSFSLSTWFYTEGDDSLNVSEFGQILFSRNHPEEETKFGVALRRNGADVELVWFDGVLEDFGSPAFREQVIATSIPVRQWTHLGMVFTDTVQGVDDDKDGKTDEADDEFDRINFYLDGQAITLIGQTERPGIDDNHDGVTDEPGETVIDMPLVGPSGNPVFSADAFKMECPYPNSAGGLILHEEGKDVGALGNLGSPEVLYFASAKNNQFGIETMDLYGFERTEILRDGITSAKEVDYNPTLDKFVYSSNKSGNYEIWIADGDGANARQITQGFGDTSRGIFARRPKWAPDSSAIVFDSNVYNMEYMDNLTHRVYHLYYIQYDRLKNEVAVPLEDGGVSNVLDYDFIIANQTVSFYRLTSGNLRNSYDAVWMMGRGKDPNNASIDIKGKIWFNSSNYKHDGREIRQLTIPSVIAPQGGANIFDTPDTCLTINNGVGTNDLNIEYSIMDGYRIVTPSGATSVEQSQIIFKKEWVTYEEKDTYTGGAFQYTMDAPVPTTITLNDDDDDTNNDVVVDAVTVDVYYTPLSTDYDETTCWDANFNGACDEEEDKDDSPGCTWVDCVNTEIPELYVQYNAGIVYSLASRALVGAPSEIEDDSDRDPNMDIMAPTGLAKDIKVYDQPTFGEEYVKIRVGSEVNNRPIYLTAPAAGNGMFLARLTFAAVPGVDAAELAASLPGLFTLKIRKINQRIGMADMSNGSVERVGRFEIAENALEFVDDAVFSPDGNRVVLSGIQKARPVVLVQEKDPIDSTLNMYNDCGTGGCSLHLETGSCALPDIQFKKISIEPMNVEGMTWEKMERYYPCNWMGAHKDRDSKLFQNAFRGGMDELRLFSYPRDPRGFLSDYERGAAWLDKEGRNGELPPKTRNCSDHYDCPAYMLCLENGGGKTCQIQTCDPTEVDACKCPPGDTSCGITGVCTMMPVPVGLGETVPGQSELSWVCAAECSSDTQCFKEECLNGPCRFCGDNNACSECRWTTREISGTLAIDEIEGCPDRNSWDCVDGSCVTECYAFENGQAIYLCDPAIEYCNQGRCKMFNWDWTDLAPSTFSSLGDMSFETIGRTTAIDQIYPVEIIAYGMEDYLHPPEILVEGRGRDQEGGNGFDKEWFKIGLIQIYNKDRNEAQENPYTVYSPIPISDVRIHLVQPLYENPSAASTGLGEWDSKRCQPNFCRTCTNWSALPEMQGNGCNNFTCNTWSDDAAEPPTAACEKRAPGSRASIGYPVGIPERAIRKACAERGLPNCHYLTTDDFANAYFTGGQAAAVVLEVKVAGMSVAAGGNAICPYSSVNGVIKEKGADGIFDNGVEYSIADTTIAADTGEAVFYQNISSQAGGNVSIPVYKRMVYGPIAADELSNQRAEYYPSGAAGISGLANVSLENEAVLNCNHYINGGNESVFAEYAVCDASLNECFNTLFPSSGRNGAIFETENGCSIERGMRRTPCYEYTGNEVTLDFMTYTGDSKEVWHTLDFDLHRSFGYDEGSLRQ